MYFGLDVHKKFIQVCKVSNAGEVLANYQVSGDATSINNFAKTLKPSDAVVLETTFNSWAVYDLLKTNSKAKIVVSDSNQVKAIAHAKVKTDKVDAEILAKLLKADFIPEVNLPEKQVWQYRQLVSHLRLLSKQRTAIKNSIWGILNRNLIKPPYENLFSKKSITPRLSQSADRSHSGRITKAGTAYGRWLAVEAANSLALSGSPITASYFKIKNKKGHNTAVTALARKLITVVWHMLKNQEPYRYARSEQVTHKLRNIKPNLPSRYEALQNATSVKEIYQQAGLPEMQQPTAGEKRAAIRNRKTITYEKRKQKRI